MIEFLEILAKVALGEAIKGILVSLKNKGVRLPAKDNQSANSDGEIKALSDVHRKIVKDLTSTAPRDAKVTIDTYQKGASLRAHVKWDARQKQKNFTNTFRHASQNLPPKILDRPLDYRWLARFGSIVIDTSDEAIQEIFGKILAGELENPGSISLSTLDILSKMTKSDAENFARFANYLLDGKWIYAYQLNEQAKGLSMSEYRNLLELGLFNESVTIGSISGYGGVNTYLTYPIPVADEGFFYITYMNRKLRAHAGVFKSLTMPALILSRAGRELVKFVKQEFQEDYLPDIASWMHSQTENDVYVAEIDANESGGDITKANFEKVQVAGDKAE